MDRKTVEDYILEMPNAVREYPFGEDVAVYKVFVPEKSSGSHLSAVQGASEERTEPYKSTVERVPQGGNAAMHQEPDQVDGSAGRQEQALRGDWKMFALMSESKDPVNVSLKCDPLLAQTLRERYETVLPGYHLNKKHWNTLVLSGQLEWEQVKDLIRHSYNLVSGL